MKTKNNFFSSRLFSMLALMVVILLVFTIWCTTMGKRFITVDMLMSVGDLMVVTSFLAVGAGLLLVSGNLDFSASAVGAFSCVLMAACLKYWELPTGYAIVIALIGGAIFGFINGVLVNEFAFEPYIATMAMSYVIKGVMQFISRSPETGIPQDINISNVITKFIGTHKLWGVIPVGLIPAIAVFIIYGIILKQTKFGKYIYLVGGNPQAVKLTGMNPKKITYILFVNSGFLSAVAGVIYMCRSSQGDLSALQQNQFTGFTAAMLGGISFGGGNGTMAGVFVGLLILNVFTYGTVSVYLTKYWTTILTGILLLIALSMDSAVGVNVKNILARRKKKALRKVGEQNER